MKICPNCQREFPDAMRFCQTDGTPLTEVVEEAPAADPLKTQVVGQDELAGLIPQDDPFKTMVASRIEEKEDEEDDVLQIPQNFDPMATMVVAPIGQDAGSIEDLVPEPPAFESIKEEIKPEAPVVESDPVVGAPIFAEPPAPVFNEPEIAPPSFAAPSDPADDEVPATVFQNNFDAPVTPQFNEPAPMPEPAPPTWGDPAPATPQFEAPPAEPQSPFGGSPFETPAPAPVATAGEWNAPPAPVQEWGQQSIGSDTPFQPPATGVGAPSSTLAIISLICGVLALIMFVPTILIIWCGIFPLALGLGAAILGFLARSRAKSAPDQYGGAGMALGGMIAGGLALLATIGWVVLWILLIAGMAGLGAISG